MVGMSQPRENLYRVTGFSVRIHLFLFTITLLPAIIGSVTLAQCDKNMTVV